MGAKKHITQKDRAAKKLGLKKHKPTPTPTLDGAATAMAPQPMCDPKSPAVLCVERIEAIRRERRYIEQELRDTQRRESLLENDLERLRIQEKYTQLELTTLTA